MNDLDIKIFIGNRTSNLYVTLERLIRNDFPRGLFNEYENSILEISQLQSLEKTSNFLRLYETEIKQQADIFKETDLQNVSSKIAACKTPTLLKQYCDKLFADNFICFLNSEELYILGLVASRSRKKTKNEYLTKALERISFATQLLKTASLFDDPLQKEIAKSETFTRNELQKLTT